MTVTMSDQETQLPIDEGVVRSTIWLALFYDLVFVVVDISNGPFARPELAALVSGLIIVRDPANDSPIHGTYQ